MTWPFSLGQVLPCTRMAAHDWTTCPFAHVGEKAVRRDPSCHAYTGVACPDMKRTSACPRGDKCPYSHNVFEYWLHPTRYRTQLCNDGPACSRKPCFFAHSLTELRSSEVRPFVSPETVARVECEVALHGTTNTGGGVAALALGGPIPHGPPSLGRRSASSVCSASSAGGRRGRGSRTRANSVASSDRGSCLRDGLLSSLLGTLRAERARHAGGANGTNHEIVINTLHSVLRKAAEKQPAC